MSLGRRCLLRARFLRGSQRSGANGQCRFRTIYPGWYPGRTVHIHAKVHQPSTTLTVQLYLPEDVTDLVHSAPPYAERSRRDTTNESDTIFPSGDSTTLLDLTADGEGHRAEASLVLD